MKASQIGVEKVVSTVAVRLDMSIEEAKALARAIDRANVLATKEGYSLDVERFGKFLDGLRAALDGREVTIQIEKQ